MMRPRLVSLLVLSLALARIAAAAPGGIEEAATHFQRGVQLYGEADYHGALVEFKRANAIAPNPQVVFDIGQTYFQLQDYANALVTFEQYLAIAPPSAPHRGEVQSMLATLRLRVARLIVSTRPEGAEVSIDDERVGTTPLSRPAVVSIGRRKVSASMPGYQPATRYVEVAAGDQSNVDLVLLETAQRPAVVVAAAPPAESLVERPRVNKAAIITPWVVTGALAIGWIATGVLALRASSDLATARDKFPATRSDLDNNASSTANLAIASDVLGGLTIAAAAASVVITVLQVRRANSKLADVGLRAGASSVVLHVSF